MRNNVDAEVELYEPMCDWLKLYLKEKYKGAVITTIDSHSRYLDMVLEQEGIVEQYPQTVGLKIQIDVLGIIRKGNTAKIVFIEAKKNKLNLHDLGQLWVYCGLCDPLEAFLLSSEGLGSLDKILKNLNRVDLLTFGNEKTVKNMKVAKWDVVKKSVAHETLIPKF